MNIKSKILYCWNWVKEYSAAHTFHMVVLAALIILGVAQFVQFTAAGTIYGLTVLNKSELTKQLDNFTKYKEESATNRANDRNATLNILDTEIAHLSDSINSRIDIIDSAIEPDLKRRMLIKKVRVAIKENTKTKLSIRNLNNIAIATIDYSYQYNIPIVRILGQMAQESGFNIRAVSHAGAQGLMQIMPRTMDYIELKEGKKLDPWNIYNNIRAGCIYMAEQITDFGDYGEALRAYNWGPNTLKKYRAGELDRNMFLK